MNSLLPFFNATASVLFYRKNRSEIKKTLGKQTNDFKFLLSSLTKRNAHLSIRPPYRCVGRESIKMTLADEKSARALSLKAKKF